MSAGAPRRSRAKSEKADESGAGAARESVGGEMKHMEPRRGDGPYTMPRLERAVARLVDGQGALLARIDALEKTLADRERRVAELESELRAADEKRANALARVELILDQLDELEGRAESSAFPGSASVPDSGG